MRVKTAGIADIAQKAAGHAVFAGDDRIKTSSRYANIEKTACRVHHRRGRSLLGLAHAAHAGQTSTLFRYVPLKLILIYYESRGQVDKPPTTKEPKNK